MTTEQLHALIRKHMTPPDQFHLHQAGPASWVVTWGNAKLHARNLAEALGCHRPWSSNYFIYLDGIDVELVFFAEWSGRPLTAKDIDDMIDTGISRAAANKVADMVGRAA